MEKSFKGKAIYNPSRKAGEYSYWACNFYVGCSNGCEYCYCKKGLLKGAMGGDKPTLKKCFIDEAHALKVFEEEMLMNLEELQKHGIFFSFTTDPLLPETIDLTIEAIDKCMKYGIPVKVLTKMDFFNVWEKSRKKQYLFPLLVKTELRHLIAFGFTLTGHDEMEPGASTNAERIEAMKKLHEAGFKTFASIEPIVDFESSLRMICDTSDFCDLYKIGLMSGKKYDRKDIRKFIEDIEFENIFNPIPIYFKDSILKQAGLDRNELKQYLLTQQCVDRDYNMFKV
ncbi:MAG: radical SAM protein [Bacteroidetes bacterium]|nr:radical SAM protein [Bacteroidota bacterium]